MSKNTYNQPNRFMANNNYNRNNDNMNFHRNNNDNMNFHRNNNDNMNFHRNNNDNMNFPRNNYDNNNHFSNQQFNRILPNDPVSQNNNIYQPVASLNPYQNNWRIKVRCTAKENIKNWKNEKGEGKVFNVDLLDKDGTEIRATMFNDAVDKFYPIFAKDKVYFISRGVVRVAKKQFTHIKNDYSISLNIESEVQPVEDDNNIDTQHYKFIPLVSLSQIQPNEHVDVLAIVHEVNPCTTFTSLNSQREIKKRVLSVVDQSAKIEVTLWDNLAEEMNENQLVPGTVIAFKGAKVSNFGGRSLSATGNMEISPQLGKATELLQWWQHNENNPSSLQNNLTQRHNDGQNNTSLSIRRPLGELKDLNLSSNDKQGEYFNVVATITSIIYNPEHPPFYNAAPDKTNYAKVEPDGRGGYVCLKTNKTYSTCETRYILRFCVSDFSGQQWFHAFHDSATKILNRPANEVEKLLKDGHNSEYTSVFTSSCFKRYNFRVNARMTTFQDQLRIKYNVVAVHNVDCALETKELLNKINILQQMKNHRN